MPEPISDINAPLDRALLTICGAVCFAFVLVWWSWPDAIDPLATLLRRLPLFNEESAAFNRPPWAFGVEAGLILGIGICPAFFFRRLSAHAAWSATGGALVTLLALVAAVWHASGLMLQIGAAILSLVINTVAASILLGFAKRDQMNMPEVEARAMERRPERPPRKTNPVPAGQSLEVRNEGEGRIEATIDTAGEISPSHRGAAAVRGVKARNGARKIGRYQILRCIGKGAMGEVFLGRDPHINRLTAIKTLRFEESFAEDEIAEIKEKFFREAESAGTLSHANIVTIYDAGEDRDLAYIAMEYLEGITLLRFTRAKRLLPVRKIIAYFTKIAEALDYAHDQGIVHRDIKPANVMVLKSGDIKITDFGIARITTSSHTQTGVVKGTPYYMSPEQFSGAKVDGRSDIFSLGTMLFQLLTGSLPFFSESPAVLMNQIMNFPHPNPRAINPRVMPAIIPIVDKALEKQADRRYPRAGHMVADLVSLDQRIAAYLKRKSTVDLS